MKLKFSNVCCNRQIRLVVSFFTSLQQTLKIVTKIAQHWKSWRTTLSCASNCFIQVQY